MAFGRRCVIARSFADIFNDNAFQNGLLPVVLSAEHCAGLAAHLAEANDPTVCVDLERCTVESAYGNADFTIAAERRMVLLEGLDEISVLLRMAANNDIFEAADRQRRPWIYSEVPA